MRNVHVSWFLVIAAASGCGGGGSDSVSTTISAADGGTLELDGTRLDIPAAALAADTEVTMRVDGFAGAPALADASDDLLVIEPELTFLALPANLTLALAAPGPDEQLTAYQLIDGGWGELDAEVDGDGVIHAAVASFGKFAVVVGPQVELGSRIGGTMRWPSGEAVTDAPIALFQDGGQLTSDTTDALGRFDFPELAPGTYHLVVTFECSLDHPVTVAEGTPTTVDLVLCGSS